MREYQEHSGAVDTNTSLHTVYTYAGGTDYTIRRKSIQYPDGRTISFGYGSTDGTNDVLSRLETIKQGTTTYATYTYLGRNRSVKVDYGEPGIGSREGSVLIIG